MKSGGQGFNSSQGQSFVVVVVDLFLFFASYSLPFFLPGF